MEAAAREAVAVAERRNPRTATTFKAYLERPLERLPTEVASYHLYQFSLSQRLDKVCPQDFERARWDTFRSEQDAWFSGVEDLQGFSEGVLFDDSPIVFLPAAIRTIDEFQKYNICSHTGVLPVSETWIAPDVSVSRKGEFKMLLVGVTDGDLDRGAEARLYGYMLISGCKYGVLSSYTMTKFCKICHPTMLISDEIHCRDAPLKGLGFILAQALQQQEQPILPLSSFICPSKFDSEYVMKTFSDSCQDAKVHLQFKMMRGLKSLRLGEFETHTLLSCNINRTACVVRAVHQGKPVMVRIADLTAGYSIFKCVREVDVFLRLHKLQGSGIPRMIQYGFMYGGMFFYIMMSDVGGHKIGKGWEPSGKEEVDRVVAQLRKTVVEMHSRGVAMNGFKLANVFVSAKGQASLVDCFEESLIEQDADSLGKYEDTSSLLDCEARLHGWLERQVARQRSLQEPQNLLIEELFAEPFSDDDVGSEEESADSVWCPGSSSRR